MSQERRLPNSLRWRAVGWMMGLYRLMLLSNLNVSVVLFSDFGINTKSEDSVSEDLFRPTTSYNTCRRPFPSSSFSAWREPLPCRSSLQTTFKHQEEESPLLRCEIVFTMQVCMQEDQLCAFPSTDDKEPLMLGKRTCFFDAATMGFCAVHRRVQIYNGE
ncbi:hypothetical protein TNCV_2443501 [Trichonephila clavipes]|nr:hypothetical protein TNCV_2443501 [Trichonephila clavipes]